MPYRLIDLECDVHNIIEVGVVFRCLAAPSIVYDY